MRLRLLTGSHDGTILEVHSTGVEPVTIDLGGCCSIQLGVSIVAAAHHELMRLREQEIELL